MKASDSKNSGGLKTLLTAMMVIGSIVALQGCSGSPLGPEARAGDGLAGDGVTRTEQSSPEAVPTPSVPKLPGDKQTYRDPPAKAN